jgi:hypothetical protein
MRHVLSVSCLVAVIAGFASDASAQSAVVDLSAPQSGKSRFVLNADLTPADLGGAAQAEKPMPVAAVSRVPACGEGCKLDQPAMPREKAYGSRDEAGSSGTRSGTRTRVIVVNNMNGNQAQQAAKPAAPPRKTFRFRRR